MADCQETVAIFLEFVVHRGKVEHAMDDSTLHVPGTSARQPNKDYLPGIMMYLPCSSYILHVSMPGGKTRFPDSAARDHRYPSHTGLGCSGAMHPSGADSAIPGGSMDLRTLNRMSLPPTGAIVNSILSPSPNPPYLAS